MEPASTSSDSGFAGFVYSVFYGVPANGAVMAATGSDIHATFQGFGEFAGMTLELSYETGDPAWAGFVVMH